LSLGIANFRTANERKLVPRPGARPGTENTAANGAGRFDLGDTARFRRARRVQAHGALSSTPLRIWRSSPAGRPRRFAPSRTLIH